MSEWNKNVIDKNYQDSIEKCGHFQNKIKFEIMNQNKKLE